MGKVSVDFSGKDNLSPALKSASARLVELRSEIEQLRAKGNINLTVGDTRNLAKLTNEANKLEKALDNVGSTGVKGANSLKGAFSGLDKVLGQIGLGGLAGALTGAGFAAAVSQVGKLAVELGNLGQQVQQQRDYFEVWSGSVGAATANLEAMRRAVDGAMTESEMMSVANKLLSMGLADNANELETMSRMAVMLGGSTRSASESIEEFSLLLANQSILRLDTFGISGAKVRERIEELMEADKNLSREQAFLNAVMEEGTRKVQALEAAGVKATTATQDLGTAFRGLKEAIGEVLAQPIEGVETGVATFFANLTAAIQAGSADAGIQLTGLNAQLRLAQAELAQLEAQPVDPNDEFGTAAARMAELRTRIEAIYTALGLLPPEAQAAGASAGVAAVRMVDGFGDAKIAADALAESIGKVAAATGIDWTAKAYSVAMQRRYAGITGAQSAEQEEYGRAMALLRTRQTRINMETEANAEIADDYVRSMKSAVSTVASEITSAFTAAQSASKGLFDFTGGAGDMFAPGSNGPFEAIYRAQAVAVGGIETDQERQWAEMYGLTPESAARIVADFQRGLFSPEVQGLINVDQLVGQIQSEQAAAESKTAFANMIAGKLGVKDAGALVASQTFQAIAGGVDADPTQQAGAAQKVLDAYISNVETIVTKGDYPGRMIGFGTLTWGYYETGLLEGAKSSTVFASAVDAAIGAWMARQAAPKQQGVVGAATSMGVTP